MRKKIDEMLVAYITKHQNNRIVIAVAKLYIFVSDTKGRITNYFKKDVSVYANHIHDDGVMYPYTIQGYVFNKGVAYSFSSVPWEDLDRLIDTFSEEDAPIDFEISHGGGWRQDIRLTPKLRKIMVDRLVELKEKEESKLNNNKL